MEVDILELSERSAKFVLSNSTAAFANGVRRAMLADVPTLAIDEVNIYNNTSVLYDEQLALRLGLIPLTADLQDYVPQAECTCEGVCPACQLSITLSAEGPGTVYSGDLVPADSNVKAADSNIPIITLKDDQKVVLEALAHVGYGKDHAKWQAGVACGYKNMPVVTVVGCDECEECIKECPKQIIHLGSEGAEVSEEDLLKCTLCKLCEGVCDIDAISVTEDESSFIFSIESDGSYSAQELIINAGRTIKEKASQMGDILSTL